MRNKKPISESIDEELYAELDEHARNERWSAWLIVAALIFEAAVLLVFETGVLAMFCIYGHGVLKAVLFIIADLLIAAGVYGELRSGRRAKIVGDELQWRAQGRVSRANQKAEEANLALAMYWTPRQLSDDAINRIADKLRPYAGVKYIGGVTFSHPEFINLLEYIEEALEGAGWIEVDCPNPRRIERKAKPSICNGAPAIRVKIELLTKTRSRAIDRLADAGVALRNALNAEPKGLEARFSVTWENPPPGEIAIIYVMIGPKM